MKSQACLERSRENRVRNIMVIKSNYGRYGGAETVLSSILKRLDRRRFHLTFVQLTHDGDYKLSTLGDGVVLGIDERVVRWKNYFSVLDAVREIRDSIRDLDIDVVYTHDMRADLIGYAMTLLTHIPWVAHIHGWLGQTACVK
ncbi:MAG: glycosyltransferase, partial [Phycisphaerae bacterium]